MKFITMQLTYVLEINGKRFSFNTNKIEIDWPRKFGIFYDKYLLPYLFVVAGSRHCL